ncbi:MAG: DNA polymerase III subunit delta [Gammaproteobacteria bacterium]
MRLKPDQLDTALTKALRPVYLICGDEPLQLGEAADAVRIAAKRNDYSVREVISIDQGNEWPLFSMEADSLSIFADKKLIDLRLPNGKPGAEGSKALLAYCEHLPSDTVLLITAGKLDTASQKAQWFQAIDKVGDVVQLWPLQGQDLLNWLSRRAQRKGMLLENDAVKSLAARVEGNLLAAAQEIEKLFILHGPVKITKSMIEHAVADSARFDVFKLTDALLAGKVNRFVKILNGLKAEGVAAPVVLWALSKEARSLFNVQLELRQGAQPESMFKKYHIWDKRKQWVLDTVRRLSPSQIQSLLVLSARADRQIKGQMAGDGWDTLFDIGVQFCRPDSDTKA